MITLPALYLVIAGRAITVSHSHIRQYQNDADRQTVQPILSSVAMPVLVRPKIAFRAIQCGAGTFSAQSQISGKHPLGLSSCVFIID